MPPRRANSLPVRLAALGLLLTLLGPTLHALALPYVETLFPAAGSHCAAKSKKCCCHRSAKVEKEPHLHAPEGMPCASGCCGAACCTPLGDLAVVLPAKTPAGLAPAVAPFRARPPTAGRTLGAPREFALFSRPPPSC